MAADRLTDLRVVDPVLTELALGYSNSAMVSEFLFPIVTVGKMQSKIPIFGKDAFKIRDTKRGIGANPNRIIPGARTSTTLVTEEHTIEYPVDRLEKGEDIFNLQQHATNVVMETITLEREKIAADLAQDTDNYATENKTTLTSTDKWSDLTHSDPIDDVEVGKEAIRSKIAKRPNLMVLGASTYRTLKNHPQLIERIKYAMKGIVTLDLMKEVFDIEDIVIGEGVYANDSDVFVDLWSDICLLAYVPKGKQKNIYQPAYGYTARREGTTAVYTYTEPNGLVDVVLGTDVFGVKIVGADAGYLISDCV